MVVMEVKITPKTLVVGVVERLPLEPLALAQLVEMVEMVQHRLLVGAASHTQVAAVVGQTEPPLELVELVAAVMAQ
jgi:hypothetical protein